MQFADKLMREQSEMRDVLKMYEELLEKMTEQNCKLKEWVKSRKHKDKKERLMKENKPD